MKKQISLLAITGAALMMVTQAHAQTGMQFFPGATGGTGQTNPGGTYIHPTGLTQDGNPNQFSVGGNIAEFIEITAIDSALEMGDLGGPQTSGTVKSANGANTSGMLVTQAANGTAGVALDSNAYVRIQATYGADLTNPGPDNIAGGVNAADDYTLPTSYRVAAKGREFRVESGALTNSASAYTAYGTAVPSAGVSNVTFSPGAGSGLQIMAEAQRSGLNNYRGAYSSTIDLAYFKF